MKTLTLMISLCGTLAFADSKTFGQDFESAQVLTMAEVLTSSKKYQAEDVVVSAHVDKICKKKGCWFEVKSDASTATKVVFKDYSFFVPTDIVGKKILMKGRLKEKFMSIKEQRHFLKDGGASKEEIKAVTKPKRVQQFIASGVKI